MIPVDSLHISRSTPLTRRGFTLIEMLIAISILMILFTMTAGVVSLAINTDRIPSSARTIQAGILGAKDRALRAGSAAATGEQPRRGVRFVANPNQPNAIGSLLYIGSQDDWTDGQITFTNTTDFTSPASWTTSLSGQNLANARIKIPDGSTGAWYRLLDSDSITRPYQGAVATYSYRLQLPSTVLPNEQPLTLDGNVVINVPRSRVPSGWDGEILFTPNGSVYGPLSAQGPIYLYLCSMDDFLATTAGDPITQGRNAADPSAGETLIIKVNTQNGRLQTFPVDPTDLVDNGTQMAPPDGLADNPFRFAQQQ